MPSGKSRGESILGCKIRAIASQASFIDGVLDCPGANDLQAKALLEVAGPNVTSIRFSNNRFQFEGILAVGAAIQSLKVRELSLSNSDLVSVDFFLLVDYLKGSVLEKLDVNSNSIENIDSLIEILPRTQLTHLNLSRNYIDRSGCQRLGACTKRSPLRSVDLSYNPGVTVGTEYQPWITRSGVDTKERKADTGFISR